MASLQERNGSFRVLFNFLGKQHSLSLGAVLPEEGEAKCRQVEYLLMRLKQGLLELPPGCDIVTFLRSDGKPTASEASCPKARRHPLTLGHLKDKYLTTHANGTVEANTLDTCRLHLSHFVRVLGEAFPLGELSLETLQDYVNRRAKAKISAVTIRKELATLRAAWNWGGPMKITEGRFPNRGVRLPKTDEKPPFMTVAEIERRLADGEPDSLWEALYLQANEVGELLAHVRKAAYFDWLYPLFAFAAHTGARRSELLRVMVADVDLAGNTVLIREKKRNVGQRSSRRVPMTPLLKKTLEEWLNVHPGGSSLFCSSGVVPRSKKRSATTGHAAADSRPSTASDRIATVSDRKAAEPAPLTRNEVHDHFKRVLAGTRWSVVRGLHTLRHSFISACASKGVDQRLVQEWAGHMNEATSRRYRHLYPSTQQQAIRGVFD